MRVRLVMQLREIMPFMVCVLAVIVVCDVSTTFVDDVWLPVTSVASLTRTLAWCVFVGAAAVRVFLHFRRPVGDGSLSLPWSVRLADAVPLAVSWALALEACFLVDASFRLVEVPAIGQLALTGRQFAFWVCSRTVSIVAFVLLALCLGAFASRIRGTGLAVVAAVTVYTAVSVVHGVVLFRMMRASHAGLMWSVVTIGGSATAGEGICQYANILPIGMRSLGMPAEATLYAPTIGLNLALAAVCLLLWLLAVPRLGTSRVK